MAGLTYHNWYSCLTIEHEKEGTEACSRIDAGIICHAYGPWLFLKKKGCLGERSEPHIGVFKRAFA